MKSNEAKELPLDLVRTDGGTQPRVAIDEQVVAEYADLCRNGSNLPPVTVFFDGAAYWLADGFHRYWANKRIDKDCISADVHSGTQRDAILYSVGANTSHGLRRRTPDKRKAVLTMLEDEEWAKWSNREIARQCGVGESMVRRTRDSPSAPKAQMDGKRDAVKYRRGGKTHTQSTRGRSRSRGPGPLNPVRRPRPALAQTNINLPHDPVHGARAIVSAMGADYARKLIDSLTTYLQDKKEGDA